jgi:hypothetical protein
MQSGAEHAKTAASLSKNSTTATVLFCLIKKILLWVKKLIL